MCEYCEDPSILHLFTENPAQHILGLHDSTAFIRFCPVCGRRLSHEKPLTVEELKEMDGEPVWVKSIWMLSVDSQDYIDYVKVSGDRLYRHKPIEE